MIKLMHDTIPQSIASVRDYERRDKWMLDAWLAARDLPSVPSHSLPVTGFIVPGIAAGFLYRTDSSIGILDGYVSNPHVSAMARDGALDAVTAALISKAKELGVKYLQCQTKIPSIEARAIRHGFTAQGAFACLFRELQ